MKIIFNENWSCQKVGEISTKNVNLPYDAMIHTSRSQSNLGGIHSSYFEGGDYIFEKAFLLSCEEQVVVFEFESVYKDAEIYINSVLAHTNIYGYRGFYVDATKYVLFGQENTITVMVKNSDQPNSRWYTGSGIIRPVSMYLLPCEHILLDGIKIDITDIQTPAISIRVNVSGKGRYNVRVEDCGSILIETSGECDGSFACDIILEGAILWSINQPKLYELVVEFKNDTRVQRFGIRQIKCDSTNGLLLNNEKVIMLGACVHHDNGLLGGAGHTYSDRRKVRILKQNGFNAIRSAHNPISKAMLDECDEIGMLVMDEYVDMWYTHKTRHDYASHVEDNYAKDLRAMIDKDYNHPCVIMYSIGNEVSESAQKRGIQLAESMTALIHSLDKSRPVTCGINIFFNYLSSLGLGVYSDKKAEKGEHIGSAFFNNLAGVLGANFMKFGATLQGSDKKTKEVFSKLDVAGYNYGINRYKKDLKKYPNRVIVGSETFCADAYKFYELAKNNAALIGDFVWSGMDYLGEVGVGSWEYAAYAADFLHRVGWISAGSGRIDLTGKPLAEMAYMRVAYMLDKIRMAVVPLPFAKKKHSPSAWKMTNAIESWSFDGCDSMRTIVEVYARAYTVELSLNGKRIGRRRPGGGCVVRFPVKYSHGKLVAIAYDIDGRELAKTCLESSDNQTILTAKSESDTVKIDELCYVRLMITDINGVTKPVFRGKVSVNVQNGELLALGNACPYNAHGYINNTSEFYYGEALAIIKPTGGDIKIIAKSEFGSVEKIVRQDNV